MNIQLIKFEKCPICDSKAIHADIKGTDFEKTNSGEYFIFHCENCGINFTNPQPAPEDIGKLYETRITPDFPTPPKIVTALRSIKVKRDLKYLIKNYDLNNINALDYGCGDAFVTYILSQFKESRKITAVDFHEFPPPLIKLCDKQKVNYINHSQFKATIESQYDLIFLRHVLEHVHNPVELLAEMKTLLTKDGILFLELPNYDTIWKKIFGKYYSALYLPRHFYHFTGATLAMVLDRSGLEIITIEKGHLPLLGHTLRYMTGLPFSNLGFTGIILFPLQVLGDFIFQKSSTLKTLARKK